MNERYQVKRVWSAETKRYEYQVIDTTVNYWVFWSVNKASCTKDAKQRNRAAQQEAAQ